MPPSRSTSRMASQIEKLPKYETKATVALELIKKSLARLSFLKDSQRAEEIPMSSFLTANECRRVMADTLLVKGDRLSTNKRTREKQLFYKAFLEKCISDADLGPTVMLLCVLALGLSGVCGLYSTGVELLYKKLINAKLETVSLETLVVEFKIPSRESFLFGGQISQRLAAEVKGMEYQQDFHTNSEMIKHLRDSILSQSNDLLLSVKLHLPYDPMMKSILTLEMDDIAWSLLPFYSKESTSEWWDQAQPLLFNSGTER